MLVPAPVPVEIMARAWHDIVREDADNAGLQGALRNLVSTHGCYADWAVCVPVPGALYSQVLICCASAQVAAARGYPKLLQKDLATGIEIVLDRAGQVNPLQAVGAQPLLPLCRHPALDAMSRCRRVYRLCLAGMYDTRVVRWLCRQEDAG